MKKYRQKYIYNANNPVYQSENVRTYNCMNIETKNKKLIIIQHLKNIPNVQQTQNILQPFQIPYKDQPFSVYPIVRCITQIQQISEPQAMYILKCVLQCKLKSPLYYIISDQGICCSDVEGILPNKSPTLFQCIIEIIGTSQMLQINDNWIISKNGYTILKSLKNNQNINNKLQTYGWKDIKLKDNIIDSDFIVFKGRRKQFGMFGEVQYGLAWNKQVGLCKLKHRINDNIQQYYFKQYLQIKSYIQQQTHKKLFLHIYKVQRTENSYKIFSELSNQNKFQQYIKNKQQLGQPINQVTMLQLLTNFVQNMINFVSQYKNKGIFLLHINNLYINNNKLCISGAQLCITNSIQKQISKTINIYDNFAPQLKMSINNIENISKINRQKADIWSFGMILHKIFSKQYPKFVNGKLIINKQKINNSLAQIITKCLDINPENRFTWRQINLKNVRKNSILIEEVGQQDQIRQSIKLRSRTERSHKSQKPKSPDKKRRVVQQFQQQEKPKPLISGRSKKSGKISKKQIQPEQQILYQQQQQSIQIVPLPPHELKPKLKKFKLLIKTIIIMLIYIFVFFRPFLFSTISFIEVRSKYSLTTLNLLDQLNNRISSTTIITSNPDFFMYNSIEFDDIQHKYQCIPNNFDPIYNPSFSALNYIQSNGFLAIILTGWLTSIAICISKALSIWRGGISNMPKNNIGRFIFVYGFHQFTIAALLFAHFFIYQFFYFSSATPCLSITNFIGLQPFFDSSLYLFLNNSTGYLTQVFSTLGILSIILLLSSCFYAWLPKIDHKNFTNIFSIIFRVIPFLLLLLICRIGVFMLFAPTAINDSTKILPKILQSSFNGFIGIIPQVFVMCCIILQIALEILMNWGEGKIKDNKFIMKLLGNRKNKVDDAIENKQNKHTKRSNYLNQSKHKLYVTQIQDIE